MKKVLIVTMGMLLLFASCTSQASPMPTSLPTLTATPLPTLVPVTRIQTFTPTSIITPSPSPIPTATWVAQGPGDVTVPILLYHHIGASPTDSRYYITPEKFEAQLALLHNWEYTIITIPMLIQAITQGIELPPRPIIITFDDGHLDNYTTAFPIMQKYGYNGMLYLVYNYIGVDGYMNVDQILEMYNAGWEIGSHSLNHADLTKLDPDAMQREILDSRTLLEQLLSVPIQTFAYPFGAKNNLAVNIVKSSGYIAAMGASGYTPAQGLWNLYYLQRVEIKGTDDVKSFTRFLPWRGDPIFLPTDIPTP